MTLSVAPCLRRAGQDSSEVGERAASRGTRQNKNTPHQTPKKDRKKKNFQKMGITHKNEKSRLNRTKQQQKRKKKQKRNRKWGGGEGIGKEKSYRNVKKMISSSFLGGGGGGGGEGNKVLQKCNKSRKFDVNFYLCTLWFPVPAIARLQESH